MATGQIRLTIVAQAPGENVLIYPLTFVRNTAASDAVSLALDSFLVHHQDLANFIVLIIVNRL